MTRYTSMTAAVAAGSMLFLGCLQARATVIFQDTFEDAPQVSTVAPQTADDVDADPVAQVGTWTVNDTDSGLGDQVTSYATPGPHDGNNYGRLVSTSSSVWDAAYTSAQTQDVTLDAWINYSAAGTRLSLQDSSGNTGGWLTWGEGTAGMIGYRNGGSWNDTTVSYSLNTWQHLTVVSHLNTQTMDVTLDGVTQTGIPFNGSVANLDHAVFASGGTTQTYLDNVVATTVPEPASLGLLALGGAALLARRKR